jgi:DNA polymerase III subunit alpha
MDQDRHFTHLHLHTEFSLLDGAISLDRLVQFGQEQKLKALAMTDHGNIFGAVKFFQKCKKAGIKPVLGMEAYFTDDVNVKEVDKKYNHLILLVQNQQGYKNLCKLISFAYQDGFYFKPRIDYNALKKYSDGLIVTTACLGGPIPQLLKQGKEREAHERIDWFLDVFGRERFYLEVQPDEQDEQKVLNQKLFDISAQRNIELVAAGDCHYPALSDHEAHEVFLAIQTHSKIDDPDRFSFGECRAYMRTAEEMLACFKGHEQAVWNTGRIADLCTFDFETGKLFFPQCPVPTQVTPEDHFKYLSQEGLEKLIINELIPAQEREQYQERLNEEVNLITNMGFVGYFLIVSDFIRWAKRNDIPVGPGRGSAAGSLVAWCLEITHIDPIKYNLLFERFLNPERVSMPDIDIDFCIEGREKVIEYIKSTYGHEKVCQIITFGTLMAKGVIKDVARTLGLPFEDANALTDLIPDQLKITLEEAQEQEPDLKELIQANPKVAKIFDLAKRLEGLTRHASKHAAGIVISPEPVDEVLPVYIPPKTNELVTQYAMTELESIGFLKIDLLGLKNLTLIDRTIKAIAHNHEIVLDINKIPLDDDKTFILIRAGQTSGVFQLESDGLKDVLRRLQPDKFEDIIAVNALYRPGPLGSGMVDDFIERRHGRQKITYLFDVLEPILKETYGVIVYQEQVMKIASVIAGYTLGQSDILRRAMGKKKAEVMAEQRALFMEGATRNQFDAKKAGDLFDLMAFFAGYGFNKSHSAAYAMIAYQTAYLKANYPAEFMAGLISLEATNTEKMVFYLSEARSMNLPIMPPDINKSQVDFTVHKGALLFGLQGIKNVGMTSLENILTERAKKPFVDFFDFCVRIDLRTSNKRVLENLIFSGAFDTMPGNRAQKYAELTKIIDCATEKKKYERTGQIQLFSVVKNMSDSSAPEFYAYQALPDWTDKEKLEKEKEVIGFYLSAHPLDHYKKQVSIIKTYTFDESLALVNRPEIQKSEQEPLVVVFGLLKSHKVIMTKKGDKMAFVQLEDYHSSAEIIVFPKLFAQVHHWLSSHTVFIVKGNLDLASGQVCKIKAQHLVPIESVFDHWPLITALTIALPDDCNESLVKEIADVLKRGKTSLRLIFNEDNKDMQLVAQNAVKVTHSTIEFLTLRDVKLIVDL